MARMTIRAEPDWRRVHDEFTVNRQLIWLNNCGTTPMPGPVLSAMEAHLRAYAARGVLGVAGEWAVAGPPDKTAPGLGPGPGRPESRRSWAGRFPITPAL